MNSFFYYFRDVYFFHVIIPVLAVILPPILLPVNELKSNSEVKNVNSENNKNKVN